VVDDEFHGFADENVMDVDDPLRIVPTTAGRPKQAISEVRIEIDQSTGKPKIVQDGLPKPNPLNDPLNDLLSDEEDVDNAANWGSLGHVGSAKGPDTEVIAKLEALAASGERKTPRTQSAREAEWIERLVTKHGDDYRAMSRDARLNRMQQSEGDIRRRVKKWKQTNTGASF
jgi:nucleolar protein 16